MNRNKKIKLGVFGFGCVGQGLHHVLSKTKGLQAEISIICVKNKNKARTLPASFFTFEKNEILFNNEIDVVVELIDDPIEAFEIVSTAMINGKAVVSANKKMIADNFETLKKLQEKYRTPFLYEGSCCASIPILRNLEEYYDNDLLKSVEGIFNGSTNYILTRVFEEQLSFKDALKEAQDLGFAETDPSLDIDAYDPKYKLCIILSHAFGLLVKPTKIFNYGIQKISKFDIQYARSKRFKIKLIAFCERSGNEIFAGVLPRFIPETSDFFNVESAYNGISLKSSFSEHQFFSGKGAGSNATGSAVLSDISALTYNYRYEYKKFYQNPDQKLSNNFLISIYLRYDKAIGFDKSLFESVEEDYQSTSDSYIVGKINFSTLVFSRISERDDVNIIALSAPLEAVLSLFDFDPEREEVYS